MEEGSAWGGGGGGLVQRAPEAGPAREGFLAPPQSAQTRLWETSVSPVVAAADREALSSQIKGESRAGEQDEVEGAGCCQF